MPAALDLVGRTFGRLTVIRSAGHIKYGTVQPAWECLCGCGRTEVFATSQLTRRGFIECAACRKPDCVICGRKVPLSRGRKNTCGDNCETLKKRGTWLDDYYRRTQEDPEFNKRRHAQRMAAIESDPVALAAYQSKARAYEKAKWAAVRNDPALIERNRAAARTWYAANSEAVQKKRRARIQAMGPEEFARWAERSRAYQRAYARRWRAELRDNPAAHQKFLDAQRVYTREWKRRNALAKLAAAGEELMKRKP